MKIAKLLFLISVVFLLSAASAAEMEKGAVKITKENATVLAINYAKANLNASDNVAVVGIELESNQKMYRVSLKDNANEYTLNVDSATGVVSIVAARPVETKEAGTPGRTEVKKTEVETQETKEKKKEEVRVEAEKEKKMQFARSGDTFNGKFISFQVSDGNIVNYTFGGKTIFNPISIGFTPSSIKTEESVVKLTSKENGKKVELEIHDNPNGLMMISTEDKVNVTFTLASGIGANVGQSEIELAGVNASIISVGEEGTVNFTLSGTNLMASLDHAKIMFKAVPLTAQTEKEKEIDDKVLDGIAHKKIGAVVSIEKTDSHDEVSFGDVNVSINTVKNNTVSVNVSSSLPGGKTIVLRINNDILGAVNPRDVRVQFDGMEIQQAANYEELVNLTAGKPEYLIIIGAKDVEALVSIPKFSEHQITLTTTPTAATATATKAPGFTTMLGALALVFAVRYFVRRK